MNPFNTPQKPYIAGHARAFLCTCRSARRLGLCTATAAVGSEALRKGNTAQTDASAPMSSRYHIKLSLFWIRRFWGHGSVCISSRSYEKLQYTRISTARGARFETDRLLFASEYAESVTGLDEENREFPHFSFSLRVGSDESVGDKKTPQNMG